MADFNRDRPRGNFRGRSNDRGFGGGRGFDRPQMHRAVCDKCRQDCEVPFKPTSGKPVYCNNCFDRPRRSEGRDFQRPQFEEKRVPNYEQQFAELNAKLDRVLNILMPVVAEVEAEVAEEEITEEVKAPKKSSKKKD